ncbi:MAG: hypothetical protein HYU51_11180 [Candidatus Rokubacteria bacterium]|nr:hypothetical protein [Candidatus Rokubacteria bacterium]
MTSFGRIAAWTGPVTFVALASRVFSGEPDGPILVLLAMVAPLVALLRREDRLPPTGATAVLALPGLAVVLWANVLLVVDLGRQHGVEPRVVLPAIAVVLLVPVLARGARVPEPSSAAAPASGGTAIAGSRLGAAGVGGLVLALGMLGASTGATPWRAWALVASRPALVFAEGSVSSTDGRRMAAPATLTFVEPHRVTAVSDATVKVLESDGGRPGVREHTLTRGQSVMLRTGDRLVVSAGTRIRFEQGKRVPAGVPSGVAWADPRGRHGARAGVEVAGVSITMLGAALALLVPGKRVRRVEAVGVPAGAASFALAAGAWGVYAMYAAPDLLVGATMLAPLTELSSVGGAIHGRLIGSVVVVALGALFAGLGSSLAARVIAVGTALAPASVSPARFAPGVWIAICGVAVAFGVSPADPWRVLLVGLGLLACTWAAPALATADRRAWLAGAAAGALTFAALALPAVLGATASTVAAYPALVAAPLAWATARVVRLGGLSKPPKPPALARAPGGVRTHPRDPGRGSTHRFVHGD